MALGPEKYLGDDIYGLQTGVVMASQLLKFT